MGSQQFCLRWNNHQSNMLSVFDQLLQDEALVDVTLACEGVSLKAHKVVLSACSPYFQSLFLDNPCQHPIVFLKDVRYTDLKALVDFMYKGEMNVSQEQLSAVIQTAESLKVKGLADYCPESTQFRGELSCQPSKVIRNTASLGLPLSDHEAKESGAPAESSSPPPPPSCSPHHPNMTSSGLPELMKRSTSPSSKRRKAKPRKRIAENAMPSDHEDSDALDLSTMSPELMESSCMDIQDGPYEGHAFPGATPPFDSRKMSHHGSNNNNGKSVSMLHLDVEDLKPHERDYNSNQNQALGSPYGMSSQTMPNVTKVPPPLLSVMTTAPLPSTSATQASIQDIRRLCQHSHNNKQHKPAWTEEDMVHALESVQCGRLTYALAARKFDIPKATLHYYVILMKAVEAVRSGRMTVEVAAIKYNVRNTILVECLSGRQGIVAPPPRSTTPPIEKVILKKEL